MDHTKTPFGGRLLRNWVAHPLTDRHRINERLDAVEEMVAAGSAVEQGGRSPGPPGLVPQPPPLPFFLTHLFSAVSLFPLCISNTWLASCKADWSHP